MTLTKTVFYQKTGVTISCLQNVFRGNIGNIPNTATE